MFSQLALGLTASSLVVSSFLSTGAGGTGHGNNSEFVVSQATCKAVYEEIEKINEMMRSGYRSAEGERLRDRLRVLKKYRYECSKAGFRE